MDTRALLRDFSSAKLALTIEPHPLDHGRHLDSIEIVQLDIAPERYRLFPGNLQTNLVEVAGVDRAIRQLVLLLPVTGDERSELNALSPRQIARRVGIAEAARQRRRGRPHVATEVCVLDPGARIYARGEIRHPDHASLALRGWHRVLPNREFFEWIPARRRARSVHWVD